MTTLRLGSGLYRLRPADEPRARIADDTLHLFRGALRERDPAVFHSLRTALGLPRLGDDQIVREALRLLHAGRLRLERIESARTEPGSEAEAPPEAPRPRERRPVSWCRILEIRFLTDHAKLKDHEKDWMNSGSRFPAVEWKHSGENHPISHTLGEPVRIEVTFEIGPPDADPEEATLLGIGGELSFGACVSATPGVHRETIESVHPLPSRVARLDETIEWSLEGADGRMLPAGASGPHRIYLTVGEPLDDEAARFAEDGVTVKRMEKAVELVAKTGTLDPHGIVAGLMANFRHYVLRSDTGIRGHPQYVNNFGTSLPMPRYPGAWAMADHIDASGECQAICRFVRGVLRQVGVKGDSRVVAVWADPGVDGGATAVQRDWDDWFVNRGKPKEERRKSGLYAEKTVEGRRWRAMLVDSPVQVGRVYPPPHTDENGTPSPGINRFEACLRFTDEAGRTRYYGGGAGAYDSADAVLPAFRGLIWISDVEMPEGSGNFGFKVEEIARNYRPWEW